MTSIGKDMLRNLVQGRGSGHPLRSLIIFPPMTHKTPMPPRRPRTFWSHSAAAAATFAAGAALPQAAQAYIGPGAGLTALGTVLALVLALGLAVVGFVWYPLKRLRRKGKPASDGDKSDREPE
ncbi:hypothetical protein [Rhodosalinus sp.]|uniref:hypothetical protein n=1 Tax=Rhodosalinus sp. TaxID=2047741 RepID=UPI003979BC61